MVKNCRALIHITPDGRKVLQAFIKEAFLEDKMDFTVTPLLVNIKVTIVKSEILRSEAVVTFRTLNLLENLSTVAFKFATRQEGCTYIQV